MPRQIDKPISVSLIKDAYYDEFRPASFVYRKARYQVAEVLDRWAETGRWWEKEKECIVWRVQLRDGGIMELGVIGTEWRLLVSYD